LINLKLILNQRNDLLKSRNNKIVLRNILYIIGSIIIFFAGVIIYGILLNLGETTLQEALTQKGISKVEDVSIKIDRNDYTLELYSGKTLVKTYKAVFGKSNSTVKLSAHDNVTPIGEYHICKIDTNSEYHKFLKLNYPNERDAAEALKMGYINKIEFDKILKSLKKDNCNVKDSVYDVLIGIHGIGKYNIVFKNLPFVFNWTNGSIAVSNENIDEIYSVVKIGTPVKIVY
jgi:murein L,D-transpeptidase YafK